MNDPKRMKQLNDAISFIDQASNEEKAELYNWLISPLTEHNNRLALPNNRFDSHEVHAYEAMDTLCFFVRRLTGYNTGWIPEAFIKHCSEKGGRPPKYGPDSRERNCIFISLMCARGASETQAMKLLMRLTGDPAMSQGQLRELQDTYRDFKKLDRPDDRDLSIFDNTISIGFFLEFDVSNLGSDEKTSENAVQAFRAFWQEIIVLMKANHELIASKDSAYPKVFGPVIDWLSANYDDPLDYFYSHDTDEDFSFLERRRGLTEYLNTVNHFIKHQ